MQVSWSFWLLCVCGIIVFLSVFTYCEDLSCFQVPPVKCTEDMRLNEKCRKVHSDLSADQIFCCNVTKEIEITNFIANLPTGSLNRVKGLHLRDSNLLRLGPSTFLSLRPNLVSLSITQTHISQWSGTFTDNWQIACFNFSNNILSSNISSQFIINLIHLKNFDISNSNISEIPELPVLGSGVFMLDVSGNSPLSCGELVKLTTDIKKTNKSLTFVNRENTTCVAPNDRSVTLKLEDVETGVRDTFDKCPTFNNSKCECSVFSLDYTLIDKNDKGEGKIRYVYQSLVNCSNLGMNFLPNSLPPYTCVLDVSNNSITSLEGLGNDTFSSLRGLYADNNMIKTLKHLEGTVFLRTFQNLTVRNNSIDQIQEYLFSNVFDRSEGGGRLMLAKNFFKCDCATASKFKIWLLANKNHVPDFDQIYADCGDNYHIKVIDLNPKGLCEKPPNWKDYIRYIIGLEVLMLVLLIGKVSYDYYVFKTAGYLPWPASKMPKLPCDWCFET